MEKDLYTEQCKKATHHEYLYHYTTLNALECILNNKSLRLTRLDKVNDPDENNRTPKLWNTKIYVTCFTNNQLTANYFQKQYNSNIRIEFLPQKLTFQPYFDSECTKPLLSFKNDFNSRSNINHNTYGAISDWCYFDSSLMGIYYTNNLKNHIDESGFAENAGMIKLKEEKDNMGKSRNWNIEAETRVRVAVRPIGIELYREKMGFRYHLPSFEYIYIPITDSISGISISRNCPEADKSKFKKLVDKWMLNPNNGSLNIGVI